jgi:hypothetical protein
LYRIRWEQVSVASIVETLVLVDKVLYTRLYCRDVYACKVSLTHILKQLAVAQEVHGVRFRQVVT